MTEKDRLLNALESAEQDAYYSFHKDPKTSEEIRHNEELEQNVILALRRFNAHPKEIGEYESYYGS